ncbi:MAG: UDP-N-acetylmuramoyl-L-alanyl-D-glutamate--2,6-diaminopimelate ligase [Patescibacteria group bacterium]
MPRTNPVVARWKNTRHFLTSLYQTQKAGYPAKDLIVIGVTGTDGKTTTAHLIYEILKSAHFKVALISTVGAWDSKRYIDTGLHTTTPDAKTLQPLLKRFKKQGITHVVLEVTSHGLDQHRVLGANFYAGVLTNLTHEHLDYHKTFANYKKAKAKLFRGVKLAVLNKDDDSFEFFKKASPKNAKIISYSTSGLADIKALNIKNRPSGLIFSATDNGVGYKIQTTLQGNYNASNILASIGVARNLGVDWKTIQRVLSEFPRIPGRMEYVKTRPFSVIVDFAHTPNALEKLLTSLNERKAKRARLIAVYGCAGERDRAKRPMMGEISKRLADISIFTAEDPRSEDLGKILSKMLEGAKRVRNTKHKVLRIPDRGLAIEKAIKLAKKGDVVAICGKGHERSLAFGKEEIPWSDQEAARQTLAKLRK